MIISRRLRLRLPPRIMRSRVDTPARDPLRPNQSKTLLLSPRHDEPPAHRLPQLIGVPATVLIEHASRVLLGTLGHAACA